MNIHILIRVYFPHIKVEELSFEEFARYSEDAAWYHSQVMGARQIQAAAAAVGA